MPPAPATVAPRDAVTTAIADACHTLDALHDWPDGLCALLREKAPRQAATVRAARAALDRVALAYVAGTAPEGRLRAAADTWALAWRAAGEALALPPRASP